MRKPGVRRAFEATMWVVTVAVLTVGCRSAEEPQEQTATEAGGEAAVLATQVQAPAAPGHGWPMWRYDAQRRAATPMPLAETLHLQWVRELPAPQRAWPAQGENREKLEFDLSYSPVVAGRMLLVASMVNDSLTAYDTRTGEQQWRFYTDGPIRLAPAVFEGRVYFGSDDGRLYCLDAQTGQEHWRIRGGPADRRLLGNGRLISMWPVRGGPAIRDGVLYYAASIWPLMGTFIHAIDARSGQEIWCNSGSGATYDLHQHGGAHAFGGVAPQGYLAVTDTQVLVSGGRTVPAVYDRQTGRFQYFRQATHMIGKGAGGYRVASQGEWFYNHGQMYSLFDGAQLDSLNADVLTDQAVYQVHDGAIQAYAPEPDVEEVEVQDRLGRGKLRERYTNRQLWEAQVEPAIQRLHLRAGDRLYGVAADGQVVAVDLPASEDAPARVSWQGAVEGTVWEMLAADDRLFVVTTEGQVYCFGPQAVDALRYPHAPQAIPSAPDGWAEQARKILATTGVREGYALMLGVGTGRLLGELLAQSDLHIIAVDADPARVEALRLRLDAAGLYGTRAAVHVGDPLTFPFPPYVASLMVSEDLQADDPMAGLAIAERLFQSLRPYGGVAVLPVPPERHEAVTANLRQANLPGAQVSSAGGLVRVTREGPMAGAGQWTHQYASASNTTFSPDQLVKAPLGVLWFGGPSNENALPRHGNGPVPQAVGGRLFLVGMDSVSARDVYTGRELWVRQLPGVGHAYTNLEHEEIYWSGRDVYMQNRPGANFIGSNIVSLFDSVYVVLDDVCLRLDAATGQTLAELRLPADGQGQVPGWGHLSVWEDLLIAGAEPHIFDEGGIGEENWNATSSARLVVMDRHAGEVLWTRDAEIGFRHNAIVTGGGRVFVIDGLSEKAMELAGRRGEDAADQPRPRLLALDARTGEPLWSCDEGIFGTWLGYSQAHDILIQAGRRGGRGTPSDEPADRIVAYRGRGGETLWTYQGRYSGPLAIHDDKITGGTDTPALDLHTGERLNRRHPLTGLETPWSFTRTYGCGTQNASTHMLTFRSGAAGFTDLPRDAGTGNLSGFRSGCTNSLIAADGVLNAPDYTRTCSCAYQNQTSLALIHMPEVEMWTYTPVERGGGVIRRLGVNLAAPGNYLAENDTLWLNHPSVGGRSPDVPVQIQPADADWFRAHASLVRNQPEGPAMVAGSGMVGLERVSIALVPEDEVNGEHTYTVRLVFAEPETVEVGARVFDVRVQGEVVAQGVDLTARTGGRYRSLVVAVPDVRVRDVLTVELQPANGSALPPVLSGIEAVLQP